VKARRWPLFLAALLALALAVPAAPGRAAGGATAGAARAFSGTARYDGDLGPVDAQTPLCICLFTDVQLTNGLGCLIFRRNNAGYQIRIDRDVYAIAFLDLHINERLDAGYAYTSVATILTRLQAKGLVVRTPAGRAFAYSAAVDEPDLAVRRISELLDSSSDRAQVLSRFIGGLPAREAKAIQSMLDKANAHKDKR
jgi:predicted transcriptional regulator